MAHRYFRTKQEAERVAKVLSRGGRGAILTEVPCVGDYVVEVATDITQSEMDDILAREGETMTDLVTAIPRIESAEARRLLPILRAREMACRASAKHHQNLCSQMLDQGAVENGFFALLEARDRESAGIAYAECIAEVVRVFMKKGDKP